MSSHLENFLDELARKGGRATFAPAESQDLEAFRVDVERLRADERRGLLRITSEHKESKTGRRYIDRVRVELTEAGARQRLR
jgi:hypothetical protein